MPFNYGVGDPSFRAAIAYEHSFDFEKWPWEYDYVEIALAKARVSWMTRQSQRELITNRRYLLVEGAAPWAGSYVMNGDLVVAFSGLPSEDDEWICHSIAARIVALEHKQELPDGTLLGGKIITLP